MKLRNSEIEKFQFVEMNNWLNQGSYSFIKLQKMISFQFYEMGARDIFSSMHSQKNEVLVYVRGIWNDYRHIFPMRPKKNEVLVYLEEYGTI